MCKQESPLELQKGAETWKAHAVEARQPFYVYQSCYRRDSGSKASFNTIICWDGPSEEPTCHTWSHRSRLVVGARGQWCEPGLGLAG